MATVEEKTCLMNQANARDPFNNNSYGTLVDKPYPRVSLPVLDVDDFIDRIMHGYEEGHGENELPADLSVARSLIPAGTASLRDFSYVAPEIPLYLSDHCTGCMDCVTECPDTAILGKVLSESDFQAKLTSIPDEKDRQMFAAQWAKTRKYYDGPQKKGQEGGVFAIIIDPRTCKGCAECVTVLDDHALEMTSKTDKVMEDVRKSHRYFKDFGPSDDRYINENLLVDMMLKERAHIYTGGAGSCAGCGSSGAADRAAGDGSGSGGASAAGGSGCIGGGGCSASAGSGGGVSGGGSGTTLGGGTMARASSQTIGGPVGDAGVGHGDRLAA